ncbi:F0F1 ATP synthase subunit A [Rubrivirga sp. IMCC45206]|uniref:F0F1 ATP synthase subunit A n=1 Tax=Rubrivirga sp. IMCC45206 TaxID=3391614 RepID=UPI00398FFD90
MRLSVHRLTVALLLLAVSATPALAAGDGGELDAVHHTSDGYYLDFSPLGKLEMPRLFLVRRDGGLTLDAFGSSTAAVASGLYAIERDGEGGYGAGDADGTAEYSGEDGGESRTEELLEANAEEILGEGVEAEVPYDAHLVTTDGEVVVDLSMTRHLVFALLASLLLIVLFLPVAAKYKRGIGRTSAPQGLIQNLLETLVIYIRDEVAKPNLGDKTDKYLPYLLTIFFFILACNLLGLVPFGATATANITTTAVLAILTFIVTQFAGTKDYWGHIFNPPGVPMIVKPILIPIEILGLFTKPFALAVRLFANMTAGHLVILNLLGLIFIIGGMSETAGYLTSVPAVLLTVAVYFLEILVAFIQAYVFTILSALFIGMATAEHEHDHDHSEDHGLTVHDLAVSTSNGQTPHKLHDRTVGTEATFA